MKTIGLIGGMSWESTLVYYRILNESVKRALGGFHSAKCLLYSVDFAELEEAQRVGDWDRVARLLSDAAKRLAACGADFVLIGTNTMHEVADAVRRAIPVPLLHIADAAADALTERGVNKVALLGTRNTMTRPFYREKLEARGIEALVPSDADIGKLNAIIFDELCLGILLEDSRRTFARVAEGLFARGAQAALLACTEIGMLLKPSDTQVPLFDTTVIHAEAASRLALQD